MALSRDIAFDIIARDRASDTFNKVGDRASKTSKAFGVLKAGALGAAAGAAAAGAALFSMGKAAAEDEKSQAILARALKNTTGATKSQVAGVEAWITAQGKALGVADDQLRPALEKLARATGDVGEAQKLASLAMDVSAGTGKDLSTVSEALMKAATGNVGALGRLGIATKDAAGETKSFSAITKDLADKFDGQASTAANTTAGKFARLKLMFEETKESIGAKLLPIAVKLGDWFLNTGVPAISKLWALLKEKLGPIFDQSSERTAKFRQALSDMRPFIDLVVAALKGVWRILADFVIPVVAKAADVILPRMAEGLGKLGRAGQWLWNNALQPVFKLIVQGLGWLMDGWAKMLKALGKAPGFGWAKEAARALQGAADDAKRLADNIKDIPSNKTVSVSFTAPKALAAGIPLSQLQGRASGGPVNAGQAYKVGELGTELFIPKVSGRIANANETRGILAGGGMGDLIEALRGARPLYGDVYVQDGRDFLRIMAEDKARLSMDGLA